MTPLGRVKLLKESWTITRLFLQHFRMWWGSFHCHFYSGEFHWLWSGRKLWMTQTSQYLISIKRANVIWTMRRRFGFCCFFESWSDVHCHTSTKHYSLERLFSCFHCKKWWKVPTEPFYCYRSVEVPNTLILYSKVEIETLQINYWSDRIEETTVVFLSSAL